MLHNAQCPVQRHVYCTVHSAVKTHSTLYTALYIVMQNILYSVPNTALYIVPYTVLGTIQSISMYTILLVVLS